MKLIPAVLATALAMVVAGSPIASQSDIVTREAFPVLQAGEYYTSAGNSAKRSIGVAERSETLAKRDVIVDFWETKNKQGKHQSVNTVENRCYWIGNGWNDMVSSLAVPNGFSCTFYRNINCANDDIKLTVSGGTYVADLSIIRFENLSFDNIISSYICGRTDP